MDSKIATLFIIGITAFLLAMAPFLYGPIVRSFAMLDQSTLFNIFVLVGILGLVFYISIEAKKHLHIPYAVTSLIFGVSGYILWNTLFTINSNLYLVLGTAVTAFAVFRRGLMVDNNAPRKIFWKNIFSGILVAIVLFIVTNFCLKMFFPDLSIAMNYSISAMLLVLGAHVPGRLLSNMGTVRFSYDMTLLVIIYNFLLFSSRILPDSILNISNNIAIYSSAITSSVYGILVGLLGAYLLHRHHKMWVMSGQSNKENLYTLTLLSIVLAISLIVGANPFIAAGIMGLLVTMRDRAENPEEHVLVKAESILTMSVFLIIGASIPFAALVALLPFGAIITLFITVIAMVVVALLFSLLGRFGFLPHAHIRSYISEVYNRHDSAILVGSLALFAAAYLRMEYVLLMALVIVFAITVEYIFPWVIKLVKSDAGQE